MPNASNMPDIPRGLFASKGSPYLPPYAPKSHYGKGPAGQSQISGDASITTQTAAINALIQAAAKHQLTVDDTALLLSIVKHESGFNPDAASGLTSASGLGQTTDSTGAEYGITKAS